MRAHASAILFGFILVAALHAPAFADLAKPKDARALQHFDEGNKFYRVREFDSAIAEFMKSLLIEESTAGWYNIAHAHRHLGHYDEAIWYYKRLLDRGKLSAAERTRIQGLVDAMEAEKAQAARSKPPIEPGPDAAREPVIAMEPGGAAIAAWAQYDGNRYNVWANLFR